MANAEGYVLPKPGIPKTLGILNVIFGVLLVLLGLFAIVMSLIAPILFQGIEKVGKETQARIEAQHKADMKAFDDRIAAASTDEEKKQIEQEKANAAAAQPRMKPVDLSAATEALNDPAIKAVNISGILSGLILHIMLLVAGIGLIRLTPWGRSMSLWWAGIQIVQVLALLAGTLVYALPVSQAINQKQLERVEAAAKAPGAGPAEAFAYQLTKIVTAAAVPMTVASSMTGLVYPIVLFILLNKVGARAACLAKKPEDLESF